MPTRLGRPRSCECGECRKCRKREYQREWYARQSPEKRRAIYAARDPEKVRAAERRRARTDARRAMDRRRGARRRRDPEYRERKRVNAIVQTAIRAGRLTRGACEVCGDPNTDAHHDDYARPLDVRWLCRLHHAEVHRART